MCSLKLPGLVTLLAMVVTFTGCSENKEALSVAVSSSAENQMLPSNHPVLGKPKGHSFSGNQLKIVIPPEVGTKWKSVELSVQAGNRDAQRLRIAIGGQQQIASSELIISVLAYLPAFVVDENTATSSSVNTENPAVLLRLKNSQGTLAEGWIFQNLPQFDTFHSDRVTVRLTAASP